MGAAASSFFTGSVVPQIRLIGEIAGESRRNLAQSIATFINAATSRLLGSTLKKLLKVSAVCFTTSKLATVLFLPTRGNNRWCSTVADTLPMFYYIFYFGLILAWVSFILSICIPSDGSVPLGFGQGVVFVLAAIMLIADLTSPLPHRAATAGWVTGVLILLIIGIFYWFRLRHYSMEMDPIFRGMETV